MRRFNARYPGRMSDVWKPNKTSADNERSTLLFLPFCVFRSASAFLLFFPTCRFGVYELDIANACKNRTALGSSAKKNLFRRTRYTEFHSSCQPFISSLTFCDGFPPINGISVNGILGDGFLVTESSRRYPWWQIPGQRYFGWTI